ncbi:type II toxin-antitoxin system RelE/ParE family toxin [Nitrincola schmidtii]|uniref:type II toxin-antitoxin system RelE/ParE family toxin n=1 Tax=Nitrincola schmidtii TaxID=1730894 RepID=UPI00124D64F6|nr:type II toxin-antitoxin system RelE/ParE family toxin [Nitrincola schmidtii]
MAFELVISPAAKSDLKQIYEFGLQQWGTNQANSYLEGIKEKLWSLIEHPRIGIERFDLMVDIRSVPVNRHSIFYRIKAKDIEIIRILHGRQDPINHL